MVPVGYGLGWGRAKTCEPFELDFSVFCANVIEVDRQRMIPEMSERIIGLKIRFC